VEEEEDYHCRRRRVDRHYQHHLHTTLSLGICDDRSSPICQSPRINTGGAMNKRVAADTSSPNKNNDIDGRHRTTPFRGATKQVIRHAEYHNGDDDEICIASKNCNAPLGEKRTTTEPVTIRWVTKDMYTLHFPAPRNSLGLVLFMDKEDKSPRLMSLTRPFCHSGTQTAPMKGDQIISVDGTPVTAMDFESIVGLLEKKDGTRPCSVQFKRVSSKQPVAPSESPVTMTAVPSQSYDYVLDFPPRSGGVGLVLSKENERACFVKCDRLIESSDLQQPLPGDSVETVDGKCIGKMTFDQVCELINTNAGMKLLWIGFKRQDKVDMTAKETFEEKLRPATSKRISDEEYELRVPVCTATESLGIRTCSHPSHTSLEVLHRDLDPSSEVTPEAGDIFVNIDGTDTIGLNYGQMVNLLKNHGNRVTRVFRLKKKIAISQAASPVNRTVLGVATLPRASQTVIAPVLGQVPVLRPGWYSTEQPSGSPVTRLVNGVQVCSSPAASFFDFDIAVNLTERGLGMVLFQFGGKAHFERFHRFASVQYIHNIVPQGGEEVIALDHEHVDALSYNQVISCLKNHGDRKSRVLRLRRYEKSLPLPTTI